jgi:hypothetical protein
VGIHDLLTLVRLESASLIAYIFAVDIDMEVPLGAEDLVEVDLGGKQKVHHPIATLSELSESPPSWAEPEFLESTPQQPPPGEPKEKAEGPKNTADAVAEAIKAANAITRSTGPCFILMQTSRN